MQQDNSGHSPGAAANERFIAAIVVLTGAFFAGFGFFEYGFWRNNGPGSGFFPTIFGVGAMVCGLLRIRVRRASREAPTAASLQPLAAMALAIFASYLMGVIVALSLTVVAWIRFVGRERALLSLAVGAGFFLFVYFIFWRWLGVNFDFGALGRLVFGDVW
ncbi:tripartite tricarboxylate transporter TctB family protein [Pikeienuella sp. HZG-20]|uniref:tripartite tricarboxylate transporter TctB family protein n=1 Tax=Paludibacillus litoralis TaxID=3133267 RepID=UPI0030EC6A23